MTYADNWPFSFKFEVAAKHQANWLHVINVTELEGNRSRVKATKNFDLISKRLFN